VVNPETNKARVVDLGGKLGGLTLNQQIMALAMWPLLQNLLSASVGFVDRVIAGRVSPANDLEAVLDMMGLMMYMGWLMMIMQASIATGAQALVSRSYGAKNYDLAEQAVGQSVFLGFITW